MNPVGSLTNLAGPESKKKRVAYFYDSDIGNYYYGQGHPMKPHRIRMTHSLLINYNIHSKLEIFKPFPARDKDMCRFHADDYVEFLRTVTPENQHDHLRQLKRFNVGEDCPVFDGLYQFCQTYTGGSVGGAVKLNHGHSDIAINWAGGLHHAKKCEASGFCYVNDIVLAILELLKYHERVLYIDIDIHHGDGVEEAFYTTDRVMTASFHKFGDYFPGTGDVRDIGYGKGKYYSVNVPLREGIDDASYQALFRPVMAKVMEVFRPGAVVLQCGADSLSGDRLGCFNLSVRGHADCVRFMRAFNVPLLLLGGGGYTIRNVARCWCYETGVAVGVELDDKMPFNEYYEYYGPDYVLHVAPSNMENTNTKEELSKLRNKLLENLSKLQHAPSVPFYTRPPDTALPEEEEEDPDVRGKERIWDEEVELSKDGTSFTVRKTGSGMESDEQGSRKSALQGTLKPKMEKMEEEQALLKPKVEVNGVSSTEQAEAMQEDVKPVPRGALRRAQDAKGTAEPEEEEEEEREGVRADSAAPAAAPTATPIKRRQEEEGGEERDESGPRPSTVTERENMEVDGVGGEERERAAGEGEAVREGALQGADEMVIDSGQETAVGGGKGKEEGRENVEEGGRKEGGVSPTAGLPRSSPLRGAEEGAAPAAAEGTANLQEDSKERTREELEVETPVEGAPLSHPPAERVSSPIVTAAPPPPPPSPPPPAGGNGAGRNAE